MTKQVQYTSEFSIINGKIDEFKNIMRSIVDGVEVNEPDVNGYQVYLDEEENKAFIVEWFRNSEAILTHLVNVGPRFPELLAIAPLVRLEVFGNLSKDAEAALKSIGAQIFKYHEGFIRGDV
ncbi:MAG TPA: antibiotic biosynthesis monooxygenase [Puia sp.]|nr:antibiotic biosynthesis monooxygenase [Puia sp.]